MLPYYLTSKKMQRVNVIFYQRARSKSANKETPINCRITINGKRIDLSTGIKLNADIGFDKKKYKATGKSAIAIQTNSRLDQFKTQVNSTIINYENEGKELTAQDLKNELTAKKSNSQSLMYVFRMHNKDIARKIGKYSIFQIR